MLLKNDTNSWVSHHPHFFWNPFPLHPSPQVCWGSPKASTALFPVPHAAAWQGTGCCSQGRTAHTHTPTGSPSPSSCWTVFRLQRSLTGVATWVHPFLAFLGREGERKKMFIKTNRLHRSVNQADLNCTAGYPCSINITPQFTEKVSLVGIDNYTLHKHKQKL